MRIISKSAIRSFYEQSKYAESEDGLLIWHKIISTGTFNSPIEVSQALSNVSPLKDNRLCFNIHGNKYRLIAKFNYEFQMVFIKFVGTHKQYDKIDANTVDINKPRT